MVRFLEQMLSAVGHLLEHGLAHNDIKPGQYEYLKLYGLHYVTFDKKSAFIVEAARR